MKLTVVIKLLPDEKQADLLLKTLARANDACDFASGVAFSSHAFHKFALQKLVYVELRERFGLSAQMAVRCIAKVADAYKKDRKTLRAFRPHGAIAYDDRILRFKGEDRVSLWTLDGRIVIPFACGEGQRVLLVNRKGECDLSFRRGSFYLDVTSEVAEAPVRAASDYLGVDLGIVNIAVDSDGTTHSGARVELARRIFAHRRRNLQRRGTRAARRKLKTLKGKQARFQKDTNHRISKAIVATAERTERGIALEELGGIRERVTAKRRQRARLANWSFYQLRSFIEYKARLKGVPVILVDPRNTSRTCPECGTIDKKNRPTQALFSCVSCGHSGPADHIAARNIRARAAVIQPMVAIGEPLAS